MSKLKIYIGILAVLFVGIVVLDAKQPKPVDWTPTYSVHDKIPFGLYVLNHEIDNMSGLNIRRIEKTPYEFLDSVWSDSSEDYMAKGNILHISDRGNIDDQSLSEIFYYVSHGNSAFLSVESFPKIFADSLNIKVSTTFTNTDSIPLALDNPRLGRKSYALTEGVNPVYFSSIDTAQTTVLGHIESDSLRPNFVKVDFNGGAFYLHTAPAAFTNVHLLKGDHFEYAQKVLSYLPRTTNYWYVGKERTQAGDAALSYISSQPALLWAWQLFVAGTLLFMVFNARRKQRVVPILEPLPNTTVDFAKTIGNLYYQEGDHYTVIERKIVYFLEKVRNDYLMDTSRLDDTFVSKFHQKSGKDTDAIKFAVDLINDYRRSPHTAAEEDLIKINTALEKLL